MFSYYVFLMYFYFIALCKLYTQNIEVFLFYPI